MSFEADYATFHLESEAGREYSPNKFAGSFFGGDRRKTGRDAGQPVSQKLPDVNFFRGAIWACVLSAPIWIVVALVAIHFFNK